MKYTIVVEVNLWKLEDGIGPVDDIEKALTNIMTHPSVGITVVEITKTEE